MPRGRVGLIKRFRVVDTCSIHATTKLARYIKWSNTVTVYRERVRHERRTGVCVRVGFGRGVRGNRRGGRRGDALCHRDFPLRLRFERVTDTDGGETKGRN